MAHLLSVHPSSGTEARQAGLNCLPALNVRFTYEIIDGEWRGVCASYSPPTFGVQCLHY